MEEIVILISVTCPITITATKIRNVPWPIT
jgi:hypothetical protein